MPWWINTGNATVVQATAAQAQRQGLFGPYPTRAAAEAALQQAKGGGSSAPWWVAIRGTTIKVIESASKPGGYSQVLGPYATQGEAQQVATTLGQPVTNRPTGNPSLPSSNLLGLPSLHDTRGLAIRVVKVVIGVALIIIGLVEMAKPGQILSKLPPVIPV